MATRSRSRRSDGYHHAQITYALSFAAWFLGFGVSIAGAPLADPGFCALAAVVGCLAGVVLSPDLDQPSLTHSEWVVIKLPLVGRWLLGPIFVAIWLPYAMLFKHRSVWTHAPVVSTLIRLGYSVLVIALAQTLIPWFHGWDWIRETWSTPTERWSWAAAVSGLMLSDLGHWARDVGIL